jgi:hypothetical protein
LRYAQYEPSTSGWNAVRYRRREARRRIAHFALGGATLLLAGAIAGLVLSVGPVAALDMVR